MFRGSNPLPATVSAGPIDLTQPHDTCIRCGRPTPAGVSLCDDDNPGRIKAPSATQAHGMILVGVMGGFAVLLILLRLTTAGVGPFGSSLTGVATRADGGLEVVVQVANFGSQAAGASCRVSASGAPSFRDFVFFTGLIPSGETRQFAHTLPPLPSGQALPANALVVRCN